MSRISEYISIIIPGYNEERRIGKTLDRLLPFCDRHFDRYEIVFADDGSTDRTVEIVSRYAGSRKVRIVRIPKNAGKGNAVREGMLQASGDYRFFTDADLPYAPESFLDAIDAFNRFRCDMIAGARNLPTSRDASGLGLSRQIGGRVFSVISNFFLHIDVKDTQCGFKGFTAGAAEGIFSRLTVAGYAFDVEIFMLAGKFGHRICKIPTTLVQSRGSKIKLIRDSAHMLIDILRLYGRYGGRAHSARGKAGATRR